ncbi:hypothetical protein [Streptomyces sp. S.PB5]|uniref:hypothetical protein n=1 Tax=Streptomyces sp. S.PB5 TaxID=3020844 RepID=UPI0025B1E576|nr:hypothetical protein [Streptomyces sp. S.PB5]MDN3020283.1 hypothetical protein [Streptomyces sp. S.PB5]
MHSKTKRLLTAGAVVAAGGLTAVAAMSVTGGGSADGPRPVSADEAQRMAQARFRVYRASPSAVTLRVTTTAGDTTIRAVVDHRRHRAVGMYDAEADGGRGLLAWDSSGVAVARGTEKGAAGKKPGAAGDGAAKPEESGRKGAEAARPGASGTAVAETPAREVLRAARGVEKKKWARRGFVGGPLDVGLRLVLGMASDRPENAQLLAQSGPLWLRDDRIEGRSLDVFSGPRPRPQGSAAPSGSSPLAYWIDDDGDLRRLTATLGQSRTVTVDVTEHQVAGKLPAGPWKKPDD